MELVPSKRGDKINSFCAQSLYGRRDATNSSKRGENGEITVTKHFEQSQMFAYRVFLPSHQQNSNKRSDRWHFVPCTKSTVNH
jgi:hypothetical protein